MAIPMAATIMITTTMTATGTTITDASLLQLIWLASPALPVGGFSYSEGLESAVEHGLVRDEHSAGDWLVDQLHTSLARSELAVVAQAMTAWRTGDAERVASLNRWVLHTRETAELRQQSEQMGRSLVEWLKSVDPQTAARAPTPLTWPVAMAKLPPLRVGVGGPVGSGKTTWWRCCARPCASAGTWWSSPTTSTPRKTSAC
jgi:hypothetical protein